MLRRFLLLVGSFGASATASAEPIQLRPIVDVRLRHEHVEEEGVAQHADAVTVRVRSGVEAKLRSFSALVEAEATLAPVARYFDGVRGRAGFPFVPDPQNIELNRAQLRYDWQTGSVTAGRQRIELLDQRFVGSGAFRQNEQTFDAVRGQAALAPGLVADVTYAWSQRTVFGINGRGARQQAVRGDNLFALLGYQTPIGTVTGFAYVVDQDEVAVQRFQLSNRSAGARFAGRRTLGSDLTLNYAASWATQRDHHRNPNRYRADYLLLEAALAHKVLSVTGGYEVLGADDGRPFTSFQTPAAALIKFQGLANRFAITPADGLRDIYATAGTNWKRAGRINAVTLTATWHRFDSDRLVRRYGDELDLVGIVGFERWALSARYARYDARRFGVDMERIWLAADWRI
jgi:hypothetical protein